MLRGPKFSRSLLGKSIRHRDIDGVFERQLERGPALQLLSLLTLHPKAWRKGAIAKDGELDCGECGCGIYSSWLEALLVKYDVVGHEEWGPRQAYCECHDGGGRCVLRYVQYRWMRFLSCLVSCCASPSILIVFRLWRTRVPEYKWVAGRLFFASGNRRLRDCDKGTVPLSHVKARKSQGLGRGCWRTPRIQSKPR